jgi:hypothetical protein
MRHLLLLPALLALAACENPPKVVQPDSPSTLGAVHADLPAPQGFVYAKNIGDTNPSGAFRVITQVLEGKDQRVEAAAAFYKQAFPTHGWILESEDGTPRDVLRLSFAKKQERCKIEIKDASRTEVVATVKVNRKE